MRIAPDPEEGPDDDSPEAEIDEALAAFGLFAEAPLQVEETFWLWPDCIPGFNLWRQLQTQWRCGMGGPTGLDYAAVLAFMRHLGLGKQDRRELFDCIQAMESAALAVFARKQSG